ncbi:DUF5658 family protein [Paenibacillus cremeus]|uniref:DUF5658 domain-containing protein n=1 Tax=Paenibacillus cremeus TaxID=2163881 RepID=A0A559KE62_9BACL|nr:DUF5658 family protein [Paenibacillus cremeus]TVY10422.1 hypothetical protein FPZ49_08485 [Paenibacillus cremeus]
MNRLLIGFVLIASVLDAGLTDIGLRLHLIGEANPIMEFLYEHMYLGFYALKIALPLSLFFLAARIGKRLLIRGLLNLSVVVYVGILLMHYYWITSSLSVTV